LHGSTIVVILSAVITGIIIADILTHPVGTQAAANGIATVTTPAYSALLGGSNPGGR
jgi:hypothetical protein